MRKEMYVAILRSSVDTVVTTVTIFKRFVPLLFLRFSHLS